MNIETELMQWSPVVVVRATVGGYQAHGSGESVEEAEDLAVARALAWEPKLASGSPLIEAVEPVVVAPPLPEEQPRPRVLNTGNSNLVRDAVAEGKRFAELASATGVEMQRVGWGNNEGRTFLYEAYGKVKRGELTLDEYEHFYTHLQSLPTYLPVANK